MPSDFYDFEKCVKNRCSLYLVIKLGSEHEIRRLTAPDFSMVLKPREKPVLCSGFQDFTACGGSPPGACPEMLPGFMTVQLYRS